MVDASLGNLNGLLNLSFDGSDFSALAVQSYTLSGNPAQLNQTVATLDATAVGPFESGTTINGTPIAFSYKVAAVNSTDNSITINNFENSVQSSSMTWYVLGFSGDSILVALDNSNTIATDIGQLGASGVNGGLAAITMSPPSVGENLSFSATSAFTGGAPCFLRGTLLQTDRGAVAVEALRVGDRVPAHFAGGMADIIWIGHRTLNVARHPRPWDVAPVRIRAGAFGSGVPHRDLMLSPDHAVLVGAALVPIRYLLNGATIVQEPAETITYFHVELAAHDVLPAEGLAVESYLDTGNRGSFANAPGHATLTPDFARHVWADRGCAALLTAGPLVQAERRRLIEIAQSLGWQRTTDPDLRVLANDAPVAAVWDGSRYCVALPPGTRRVTLHSRAAVPAETWIDGRDGRRLGIAFTDLRMDRTPVSDSAFGEGWHRQEEAWRWTNGRGVLDVGGARELTFAIARAETYWLAPVREAVAVSI